MQDLNHTFKVVIIGDSGVGKSSILLRAADNVFSTSYLPSIGVDFKIITDNEKSIKLQIWDTAGQERFRTISASFYKNSRVFAIVFDVSNRQSFDHVQTWLEEAVNFKSDGVSTEFLLIGSKTDLENERVVSFEEGETLALKNCMSYLDFSSKNGTSEEIRSKLFEVAAKLTIST